MSTFQGKGVLRQVDPNEIPGHRGDGYPELQESNRNPREIDFVVCAVPRPVAPLVCRDCVAKKVGGVGLFTSGFAETETEEGIATQDQITKMAREGATCCSSAPNCMGL